MPLLLKLLDEAPPLGEGGLPLPRDRRLLAICEHMMTDPANDYTLDRSTAGPTRSARAAARSHGISATKRA
ncbi:MULTISPECIES: hypothetical protein [Burkholderia cepacia complex]|uniref:hypothetical protein n=1 Tax=Burkholderia cepacia complex TaxID=87882 RepID=UPI001FC8BC86|nr:hypothetical protein [Burkholderia cenocepacia]